MYSVNVLTSEGFPAYAKPPIRFIRATRAGIGLNSVVFLKGKIPKAAISIADMTNVDTSISIANRPSHLQSRYQCKQLTG